MILPNIKIKKTKTAIDIKVYEVSPDTGREFEYNEMIFLNNRKEVAPGGPGPLTVEQLSDLPEAREILLEISSAWEKFVNEEAKILKHFKVAVKKFHMTAAEAEALSQVELTELLVGDPEGSGGDPLLNRASLRSYLASHGYLDRARQELRPQELESYPAEWKLLKKAIHILLSEEPDFNLGVFASKARTRSSVLNPAVTYVDRQGFNAVTTSGEIIGEPSPSAKIELFCDKMLMLLRNADHQEFKSVSQVLVNLMPVVRRDLERDFERAVEGNARIETGYGSGAIAALCERYSEDRIRRKIKDLIADPYSGTEESLIRRVDMFNMPQDVVALRLKNKRTETAAWLDEYFRYASIPTPSNPGATAHIDRDEANSIVEEEIQTLESMAAMMRDLKQKTIARMREENRPITVIRCQKMFATICGDIGGGDRLAQYMTRSVAKQVFGTEAHDYALEHPQPISQVAAREKKPAFMRVSSPETAAKHLIEKSDLMDDNERSHLINVLRRSHRSLQGVLRHAYENKQTKILESVVLICGQELLTPGGLINRYDRTCIAAVIEGFVAAGIPEAAPMECVTEEQLPRLFHAVPDEHLRNAFETFFSGRTSGASDEDVPALEKALERLRRVSPTPPSPGSGASRSNVTPGHAFQLSSASAKKVLRDNIDLFVDDTKSITYRLAHTSDQGLGEFVKSKNLNELNSVLLHPELSLHYFCIFHELGRTKTAARYLKAALAMEDNRELPSELLSTTLCQTLERGWGKLMSDINFLKVRAYADALIPRFVENQKTLDSYTGRYYYHSSGDSDELSLVRTLFSAGGMSNEQALGHVTQIYGSSHAITQAYMNEVGKVDDEKIIEDILRGSGRSVESHNRRLVPELIRRDPRRFAGVQVLSQINPDTASKYPDDVMMLIANQIPHIIDSVRRNQVHYITHIFSLFATCDEIVQRILFNVKITPMMAVAVAKGLTSSQREIAKDRLLAFASSSQKAEALMREILKLPPSEKQRARDQQTTPRLVERVAKGDRSLTESQWDQIFGDSGQTRRLIQMMPIQQVNDLRLFAKSINWDIRGAVVKAFEMDLSEFLSQLDWKGGDLDQGVSRVKQLCGLLKTYNAAEEEIEKLRVIFVRAMLRNLSSQTLPGVFELLGAHGIAVPEDVLRAEISNFLYREARSLQYRSDPLDHKPETGAKIQAYSRFIEEHPWVDSDVASIIEELKRDTKRAHTVSGTSSHLKLVESE